MYAIRRGLGDLETLAPNDPALQTTPEDIAGTTFGGRSTEGIFRGPLMEGQTWAVFQQQSQAGLPSFTNWINQNQGLALGIAGGFVALLFLAKAGR